MAIKSILVHLSEDPRAIVRRDLALGLARAHEARLTALYILPAVGIPGYLATPRPATRSRSCRTTPIRSANANAGRPSHPHSARIGAARLP